MGHSTTTSWLDLFINAILKSSVSDPSHFDVDPDPGIHIWEKWIRILGFTFGKSGSGSSDPPFRNSGSGSLDPHLEKVDPVPKWIRIRVPIFHKEIHVGQITMLICYRQNLEKAFLR